MGNTLLVIAGILPLLAAGIAYGVHRIRRVTGLPGPMAVIHKSPEAEVRRDEEEDEDLLCLSGRSDALALNEVAGRCWELMDGSRSLLAIARLASAEFDLPPLQALSGVRRFARRLKMTLLAMEQAEWDLIHTHDSDLFAGAASPGIAELHPEETFVVHAASCIVRGESVEPWSGGFLARRYGRNAMRAHQSRERKMDLAAVEFRRGWDLCAGGKLEEAAEAFRVCVREAPRWANAHYQLGYVSLRLRQYGEAENRLREVEELSPGYYMVREYLDQSRRLAAGTISHEAFELLDRANSEGLADPDRTIEMMEQALELSPRYPAAHLIMARAYEKKKMLGNALRELTRTVKLDPDQATLCHALLSRGNIFLTQGQANLAMMEYQKVIELDGSASATRSALDTLSGSAWVH